MKIYKDYASCMKAAQKACEKNGLSYTEIRAGVLGLFECFFVYSKETDRFLFVGAYYSDDF